MPFIQKHYTIMKTQERMLESHLGETKLSWESEETGEGGMVRQDLVHRDRRAVKWNRKKTNVNLQLPIVGEREEY